MQKIWLKMAKYEKKAVYQELLVVWRWYSPNFNHNACISTAFSNIEWSRVEYQALNSQFLQKYGWKWLNMRKIQYLGNGWSYRDGLALMLTVMPTFLLYFQILKGAESNIKPKIANLWKKNWLEMAKDEKKAVYRERLVV